MRIDYGDRYEKWPFFHLLQIVAFMAFNNQWDCSVFCSTHSRPPCNQCMEAIFILNSQGHRTFFWAVYNISLGHTLFHFCHLSSTKSSEELLFKWLDCYADEIGLCRRGTRYHAFLHIYSTPCFMHRCPLSIIQQATLLVVSPTCDTTTPSVTE